MRPHGLRVIAAGGAAVLVVGSLALLLGLTGRAAGADESLAQREPLASAEVARRTIQSTDVLDGTLGFAGDYTIANLLETSPSSGANTSAPSATEAYLSAKAQYDTAVAARDALRDPSAADIKRAQATLAQAQAALATARAADDGPTSAQSASARAGVTQATEALTVAKVQRDAAQAALDGCAAAAAPMAPADGSPDQSAPPTPCDRAALEAALARAEGDVRVKQAQLDAAKAALNGLDDAPPNAAANIASAQASVTAASAALDALRNPTAARLRQSDDAVAAARAQLTEAARALDRPSGMITFIVAEGAVVEPGGILYTLDGFHSVVLLKGEIPAWRRLAEGVADGPDVGQLERNLAALGFGHGDAAPDDHWDEDTTAAVREFQGSLGLNDDGAIELGDVVYLPGAIRATAILSDLGATIGTGSKVLRASTTDREVSVDLEADRQQIVALGAKVSVGLPDGTETAGTVTDIGTVATVAAAPSAAGDAVPTVAVTVALDDAGAGGTLDGAPVTVTVVRESRQNVLAVPVGALLALAEGGYAVEIIGDGGTTHLVGVELGLFEDGFVEVRSEQLREGVAVVVPA
jgi:peptidoglycan hydrolase-like protein with peptidoglycan-binding domain